MVSLQFLNKRFLKLIEIKLKMKINILFFFEILFLSLVFCNIVYKPIKYQGNIVAYIFIQGADIPAINYNEYVLELQKKFDGKLKYDFI